MHFSHEFINEKENKIVKKVRVKEISIVSPNGIPSFMDIVKVYANNNMGTSWGRGVLINRNAEVTRWEDKYQKTDDERG